MTIAEQLTRAKADLDAVYAAGMAAGGGTTNRKEYAGDIVSEVVGTSAYVTLLQDDLLAKIRTLDTLFVRVESDTQNAGSVVKTWANNGYQYVIPSYNNNFQTVHRLTSAGADSIAGNSETLYSTSVDSKVGLVNITEDGELRWYSGSTGTYKIRTGKYKVIVEW